MVGRISGLFCSAIVAVSVWAVSAQATPILVGDSNSSIFSNLGCSSSCPNTSLTSTTLTLGSTDNGSSNSILSIVSTSFLASGTQTGLQLAELSLLVGNKPGLGQTGVTFKYTLVLTFSTPAGLESQIFNLGLTGDDGPGANADVIVTGLGPLSLTDPLVLSGVTLSNFHFSTVAGDADSVFSNGSWDGSANAETHLLYLLADVTATGSDPVPEPASLALFGAGLLGLCLLRRRASAT